MSVRISILRAEDFAGSAAPDSIQPIDADTWRAQGTADHLLAVRDGLIAARCSIWNQRTPVLNGQHVGLIGHYAACDTVAGSALLCEAAARLMSDGFGTVVGPMDGSTWRRYRVLTQRGSEPAFFLEPENPDDWQEHFTAAGFAPLATYFSSLCTDLTIQHPRGAELRAKLEAEDIHIRSIDLTRYEQELSAVFDLATVGFADNFLYTPISRAEFMALYGKLRPCVRPELVLLAERRETLVGFIFGVPDQLEAAQRDRAHTAIAKSMAVHPDLAGLGLGSILIDQFHQSAHRLGYARVIHALMYEDNRSLRISAHFGAPFRQYTLYSKAQGA